MKRLSLLILFALLLVLGSTNVMAQGIIIAQPTPTENPDLDGDGLPNTRDLCPTVAGALENNGCPQTFPPPPSQTPPPDSGPNNPPPGDQPPPNNPPVEQPPLFTPPGLPVDGCFVTPSRDNRVNVRSAPDMNADVIGSLLPGVVYPALGFVVSGADVWMQLLQYEGGDGVTPGYSAQSVLMTSQFCPAVGDNATSGSAANDFASTEPDQPILCYLSVGYDPAYWGSAFDPQLGNEPVAYAAFYFEREPGQPIFAGTPIWGVVSIDGYHELPPDSPLFFDDPDNAVATVSSQSVIDAAVSGGVGAAFNLAFPNPNGGVMSTNGTTFYRLSDPDHVGNCGPIVAVDDLVVAQGNDDPAALQCFVRPGTTLVESCWCQTSDSACVDLLTSLCYGGGAYVESGPDMTACWYDPLIDTSQPGDMTTIPVALPFIDVCADDLTVWWIDVKNPYGDPFQLHDLGTGNCAGDFDQLPSTSRPVGSTRLVARLPQPEINDLSSNGESLVDCDQNGVIDAFQSPVPNCTLPRDGDKEHAAWWMFVLDLSCGGHGWIIATEIDQDGDEVVTDAVCDD